MNELVCSVRLTVRHFSRYSGFRGFALHEIDTNARITSRTRRAYLLNYFGFGGTIRACGGVSLMMRCVAASTISTGSAKAIRRLTHGSTPSHASVPSH